MNVKTRRRAAEALIALDKQHVNARARKIRGSCEAVQAPSDDNGVVTLHASGPNSTNPLTRYSGVIVPHWHTRRESYCTPVSAQIAR